MKTKLIEKLWLAICLATVLAACHDDDYEGPSPDEVNATYSNLLAMGDNPTLDLTYNGQDLIGKNIYFKMTDAHTGMLSLERVIPGEDETNIEAIALTASTEGYSFSGATTGNTGVTFHYEGKVEKGRLKLALDQVQLPANRLSNEGTWTPTALNTYKDETTLTGVLLSAMAYPALQTVIATTLGPITFGTDGNIVAHYAGLPEGVTFTDLMSGTVQPRPEDEWKDSPTNLVTFSVRSDTLLYVYPNIDGIIRRVQTGKGRAASLPILSIVQIYSKLHSWATQGIRLVIREGRNVAGETGGGIWVQLDKEEVRMLFEVIRVLGDLLPEDTLGMKAADWLGNLLPESLQGMLGIYLKDLTVAQLMEQVYTDLDTMPFYVGLYLSN